jgi:hemerythrin-like domain-containing protein
MREHGVLNRALLVYEEGLRRLRAKEDVPPEVFRATATLVRKFVEDYHEKLEENFIFPAFEKKNTLTDLVKVLKRQHDPGRTLTDVILREAADDHFKKEDGRKAVVEGCEAFIRMYRPHEAREDTVCSRRCARFSRPKTSRNWASSSRRRRTSCSARAGSRRSSSRSPGSRRSSASTTSTSSRRNSRSSSRSEMARSRPWPASRR